MGRGGDSDGPYPTPPASARSNASVRSAASYRKLESRHATQKLADLISMKVQMDATMAKTKIPARSKTELMKLASDEAAKAVNSGSVQLNALPKQIRAGFLLRNTDASLAAAVEAGAEACVDALADSAAARAAPTPAPVANNVALEVDPAAKDKTHPKFQRRLPPVNVAGRQVPLELLIRDKIMQRGRGGAHQLRKAFQVFDADGNGLISVDEMEVFLNSINIKVARKTLYRFFELWASDKTREDMDRWDEVEDDDKTTLNYMEFIQKILPADYPKRENMYSDDIASLAFEDRAKPMGEEDITTTREFEIAFRDKVASRSVGGGSEQMKQFKMFDEQSKGYVAFDDLIRSARRWNLNPSEEVLNEIKYLWCKPENRKSGVIDFYDFVNKVLPKDFKDVNDVLKVFYLKMTENWTALRDAFRNMDRDGSGTIDRSEILDELKRMNIIIPPDLAQSFADQFDSDGDGEIDFAEFSRAIRAMDPDKKKKDQSTIGLLWDPDQYAARRILEHRPPSHASLHSEAPDDELTEENQVGMMSRRMLNKHGVDMHEAVSVNGRLVGQITVDEHGHFLQDGIPINFTQVLRDKIYRKRGGVHELRNLFQSLDKDGSGAVSRFEFREFLKPYNLNLSDDALMALVDMFDDDSDGLITFNEFCQRVMPNDYDMLTSVDATTGTTTQTMQGVPSMVRNRARRIVQPAQKTNFGMFDSKMLAPAPTDARAINLIREKVAQRTRNANDNGPGVQLRDALALYDHQKSGRIEMDAFRRVLERYNVFLEDCEFDALAAKYVDEGTAEDAEGVTMMEYKPFLAKVLAAKHGVSGAFGPHVPGQWVRVGANVVKRPSSTPRPPSVATAAISGMREVPAANRPNSPRAIMTRPGSVKHLRASALKDLSAAMYYTPRSVAPFLASRSGLSNVSGKIGSSANWGGNAPLSAR